MQARLTRSACVAENGGSAESAAKFRSIAAAYERACLPEEQATEELYEHEYDDGRAEAVFERQFRAAAERAYRQQQAASAQAAARPGGWFPNVFANFFGDGGGHGENEIWDDDIGALAPFSRVSWTGEHEEQLRKLKAEMEQQVGCFRSGTAADQRNPQRFYDFFGAGFSSLAPYSKRQPVPRLGDAQSPLPTVHAFYRF